IANVELVSAAIALGKDAALEKTLKAGFGLAMPSATQSSEAGGMRALRLAPDQVMLMLPDAGVRAAEDVAAKLGHAGYVTLQTDAWMICEVSGPGARSALERLCPLDLDPQAFGPGQFARTVMEHMSAVILRTGADSYVLMSASSSAGSFAHAVETSLAYTT
ncbi:MAG: sarcosine oxidase subunit gamma family protein, partial [Pseudomonadota bacterium]